MRLIKNFKQHILLPFACSFLLSGILTWLLDRSHGLQGFWIPLCLLTGTLLACVCKNRDEWIVGQISFACSLYAFSSGGYDGLLYPPRWGLLEGVILEAAVSWICLLACQPGWSASALRWGTVMVMVICALTILKPFFWLSLAFTLIVLLVQSGAATWRYRVMMRLRRKNKYIN